MCDVTDVDRWALGSSFVEHLHAVKERVRCPALHPDGEIDVPNGQKYDHNDTQHQIFLNVFHPSSTSKLRSNALFSNSYSLGSMA